MGREEVLELHPRTLMTLCDGHTHSCSVTAHRVSTLSACARVALTLDHRGSQEAGQWFLPLPRLRQLHQHGGEHGVR